MSNLQRGQKIGETKIAAKIITQEILWEFLIFLKKCGKIQEFRGKKMQFFSVVMKVFWQNGTSKFQKKVKMDIW